MQYKLVNYFKVVTFHDSTNFITMYPSTECENLPCVDLNYMQKDKKLPEVKIKSPMDKFKERLEKFKNSKK